MGDLLGDTRFVTLTTTDDARFAQAIRDFLRRRQVFAVIVNPPAPDASPAAPAPEYRLEVPDLLLPQAQQELDQFYRELEQGRIPDGEG